MGFKKVFGSVAGLLCAVYGAFLGVLGVLMGLTDIPEISTLLGTVTVDSFTANQRSAHLFLGMLLSFILAVAFFGSAYFSSEGKQEEKREEKSESHAP